MADFKIKGANRRPFKPRTLIAAVLVVALLVVWAHRKNIAKLCSGTESRFSFKRAKGGE